MHAGWCTENIRTQRCSQAAERCLWQVRRSFPFWHSSHKLQFIRGGKIFQSSFAEWISGKCFFFFWQMQFTKLEISVLEWFSFVWCSRLCLVSSIKSLRVRKIRNGQVIKNWQSCAIKFQLAFSYIFYIIFIKYTLFLGIKSAEIVFQKHVFVFFSNKSIFWN